MARPAGIRGLFLGAAALALAGLLWLHSGAERALQPEVAEVAPQVLVDPASDATARTDLVLPERRARETPASHDALPARENALQVDVLDAGERPAAGVTLACGLVSSSAPEIFSGGLRKRTDAHGSAWIELSELPRPAARSNGGPEESLRLRCEILAEPAPELVLGPDALESRHVVLRLPPTGSVRLELVGELDRSAPRPARFAVWARAEGASTDLDPLPRWFAAPHGVAVLEHVGLGLELRVAAALDGDEAGAERVADRGPLIPGEERTISVPLGAEWPSVLVRALDEQGNVLSNVLLDAEVKWDRPQQASTWSSDASQVRRVQTDGEGRARFPLRGTVAGGYTRRLVLEQRDPSAGEEAGAVLRSAERDLSWDVAAGSELDLGDLELRPPEREPEPVVWVSGSVADTSGSRVPAATVLVSAIDGEGAALRARSAQVDVEPDGRFVVRGPPVEERLSVRALAPGFLHGSEEIVVPGASDLSLTLQPAARWTGRLLLDADTSPESLVVAVFQHDRKTRTVPASERIAVDDLEAGRVDVEVRTRTGDWLVERREQLPTSSAGKAPDAQEIVLDLRGRLTRLQLQLAQADGTPFDRVFARVQPEGWPESGAWIRAGRLELLVPSAAPTFTVQPRGHAPETLDVREGLQELTWPVSR